jgi:aarF domain-containing kinase
MPPGRAYNWLTVAHSVLQVLDHALAYRAAQVQLTRAPTTRVSQKHRHSSEETENNHGADEPPQALVRQSTLLEANEAWLRQLQVTAIHLPPISGTVLEAPGLPDAIAALSQGSNPAATAFSTVDALDPVVLEAEPKMPRQRDPLPQVVPEATPPQDVRPTIIVHWSKINPLQVLSSHIESERHLQSSKVPSSRIGRLFHYGGTHILDAFPILRLTFTFVVSGLAASLGYGAASEYLRRSTTSSTDSTDSPSSLMMTEANLTRLVSKLTRMRGAALKVGQFLSIQGPHLLPHSHPARADLSALQTHTYSRQN